MDYKIKIKIKEYKQLIKQTRVALIHELMNTAEDIYPIDGVVYDNVKRCDYKVSRHYKDYSKVYPFIVVYGRPMTKIGWAKNEHIIARIR